MKKIIDKIKQFFHWLFFGPDKKTNYKTYKSYIISDFDWKIFDEINKRRGDKGLELLSFADTPKIIDDINSSHITWLQANVINKEDFDVKGHYYFQERADQIQLRFPDIVRIGENVAYNYQTAASYVSAWANSPKHAANMFGDYTHIAIASGGKFATTIYIKIP